MNESIKQYLSNIGKLGGKASGGNKAEASRKNGKLGGRPSKIKIKANGLDWENNRNAESN